MRHNFRGIGDLLFARRNGEIIDCCGLDFAAFCQIYFPPLESVSADNGGSYVGHDLMTTADIK